MKHKLAYLLLLAFVGLTVGCGPKAFVKGDYDDNVNDTNLLTDRWSETDMQKTVHDLVSSAVNHPQIANAKKPPIVMVTKLQNKTSEVIDTQSITDMITVELTNSGRVQFVDKAAREDISEEYDYQDSGTGSRETKKAAANKLVRT